MNGRPATSTRDLGVCAATAPRRVARPPARRATGTSPRSGRAMRLFDDDPRALEVEREADLSQCRGRQGAAQARLVLGIEEEEAAAPGADALAAQRAAAQRQRAGAHA